MAPLSGACGIFIPSIEDDLQKLKELQKDKEQTLCKKRLIKKQLNVIETTKYQFCLLSIHCIDTAFLALELGYPIDEYKYSNEVYERILIRQAVLRDTLQPVLITDLVKRILEYVLN